MAIISNFAHQALDQQFLLRLSMPSMCPRTAAATQNVLLICHSEPLGANYPPFIAP